MRAELQQNSPMANAIAIQTCKVIICKRFESLSSHVFITAKMSALFRSAVANISVYWFLIDLALNKSKDVVAEDIFPLIRINDKQACRTQ